MISEIRELNDAELVGAAGGVLNGTCQNESLHFGMGIFGTLTINNVECFNQNGNSGGSSVGSIKYTP